MTFEDKFSVCIQNFQNQSFPTYTRNELYLFADFIELLSLFSKDKFVTVGSVQDRFFGEKEYENDRQRDEDLSFIQSIFLIVSERQLLFNDCYPFFFDEASNILYLKSNLSDLNKFYLSLLVSSKLNIFNPFKSELTTEFEFFCKDILENFLPNFAVIKNFGRNTAYEGNAITKIKQLAMDLNLDIEEYEIKSISERNNQERGLDIVGWLPFDDKCKNLLVFLAQCACGKDYESKQHDVRRFMNYLKFYKSNPIYILFIPYSLINRKEAKFYHSDLIEKDYLIFERKRLIEFFNTPNYNSFISHKIVDFCILHTETMV